MWFDNYRITKTPFDPGAKWGAQNWDREWNGETHDYGDDIPGTSASPTYFTNLLFQSCQGCGWTTPGVSATTNYLPARYGLTQDTSPSFHIWTK
jgi:hypothetical protein